VSDVVVRRDGDVWTLGWAQLNIGMCFEGLRESSDGLKALVTVDSPIGGRVLGPVRVDVLSMTAQGTFGRACSERITSLSKAEWQAMTVQACAIVAKQYRQPQPVVDLSTLPDPGPVKYLVDGLVPLAETTVLYGDGESAKSLLALAIGMSVTTGQELPWGSLPRQTGNVLYLDWETNRETLVTRLRGLARGLAIEPPKLFYRQCFRSLADELPSIREEISRKAIELVIVDSIGFAAAGSLVEDETARSAMNGLRQMSPATRLVVAHVSKGSVESSGPAKPFGSAFFWNGMRSGIEIRRAEAQPSERVLDLGLFHRKSNDGRRVKPFALTVLFEGEPGGGITLDRGDIHDVPELDARTSASQRIRALLARGAKSTGEIAEELEMKEVTVRSALHRMNGVRRIDDGLGGRDAAGHGKQGVWGLTE
jgi:hypothetical protein